MNKIKYTIREAFEAWYKNQDHFKAETALWGVRDPLKKTVTDTDRYYYANAQISWEAWQAATKLYRKDGK